MRVTNHNLSAVLRQNIFIAFTLAIALAILNACTPSTTVVEVTRSTSDVVDLSVVNIAEIQTVTSQISQVKTFDQCASASPLKARIQFSSSNSQSSQRELVLTAGAGGQLGLTPAIAAQIEAAIEQHFISSGLSSGGHQEEVEIEVPARSRQEYSIIWQESRREGTVDYIENGETKTVSYSYRIGLELNSSTVRDLLCPGQSTSGSAPTAASESNHEASTQEPLVATGGDTAVPTVLPVSSLPLPFEDNFDSGLRPEWQVIAGQPVVANGSLKPAGYDMLAVQVGDESLGSNFSISMGWYRCTGIYADVIITLGEQIRFRFDGSSFYWEAFQNNEWVSLQRDDTPSCQGSMQFRVAGDDYSILDNGELFFSGTYGQPPSGPVMLSLEEDVTIDNFRITSP